MRHVLNWVGGGFFRTIGRTLAFLALGALAYYLFSKSSFDIKDLFFTNVKASTTSINSIWQNNMYNQNGQSLSYDTFGFKQSFSLSQGSNQNRTAVLYFFNNQGNTSGGGLNLPSGNYDYVSFRLALYSQLAVSLSGDYSNSFMFATQNDWGSGSNCEIISDNNFQSYQNSSYSRMLVVKCPIINGTQSLSSFNMYINSSENVILYSELSGDVLFFKSTETTNQQIITTIEEQTQQQQQNHEETMDYLEDTNSTETDETATSFFDDFQDTDHGGLSSIITAPLVVINEMLNGVCVQPSATWKGATISLPCGDMLWSRNGASDLKNLLNIFYGGVICYYAIRKLFMMIEGLKDPTQDRIEVTDL